MPVERRENYRAVLFFFSITDVNGSVILLYFTLKWQFVIVIIFLRNNFKSIFKRKNRRLLDLY